MYKDKEKQKEANRLAAKRYREKSKGMTQGVTTEGMTQESVTDYVIPKSDTLAAMYQSDQIRRVSSNHTQSVVPTQSHNPMMVGYVPPRET